MLVRAAMHPRSATYRIRPGLDCRLRFSNRFEIKIDGTVARLVFGDALVGKHAAHHTRIIMKTEDLQALGEAVGQLLAKAKQHK
jgi:hypothetical protein